MNKALLIPTIATLLASPTAEAKPIKKTPAPVIEYARMVQTAVSRIQEGCFVTIQMGELEEAWDMGSFSFSNGESHCECDRWVGGDVVCRYTEPNEETTVMLTSSFLRGKFKEHVLIADTRYDDKEGVGKFLGTHSRYTDGDNHAYIYRTKTSSVQEIQDLMGDAQNALDFLWETGCKRILRNPPPPNDIHRSIPEQCAGL